MRPSRGFSWRQAGKPSLRHHRRHQRTVWVHRDFKCPPGTLKSDLSSLPALKFLTDFVLCFINGTRLDLTEEAGIIFATNLKSCSFSKDIFVALQLVLVFYTLYWKSLQISSSKLHVNMWSESSSSHICKEQVFRSSSRRADIHAFSAIEKL